MSDLIPIRIPSDKSCSGWPREDLRVRAELAADGSLFHTYHPHMRAVHDRHAARLAQILAEDGWPDESWAGVDGCHAAWLIVQHAIAQPRLQRPALRALCAAEAREGPPSDWEARRREMEVWLREVGWRT